mgnify:CR=1 FL=1
MTRFPARTLLIALAALALLALPMGALAQDDLTQTYTTADGALTFQHPANWAVVEQFGTITLANSQAALDALNRAAPLEPGQFTVAIVPPAGLVEQLALLGLSVEGGPEALIADYVGVLGAEASFSAPEAIAAGNQSTVKTSGVSLGMSQALYAVEMSGGGMALIAAAAPDDPPPPAGRAAPRQVGLAGGRGGPRPAPGARAASPAPGPARPSPC